MDHDFPARQRWDENFMKKLFFIALLTGVDKKGTER